jgi:hypothetical protein
MNTIQTVFAKKKAGANLLVIDSLHQRTASSCHRYAEADPTLLQQHTLFRR